MARISEKTLEQIRHISIESIVSPYVDFVKKGADLWACCPFHAEDTPSFKINTDKNFYKCFGCDAKGDTISFIRYKLGYSYPDAIIYIAEKYGINVEYEGEDNVYRKDILALHEDLQVIMRNSLYTDDGTKAREYILNRGFTDDDLNTFGLGYIPPRYNYSEIYRKYSKDVLFNSGYFKEGQYGVTPRFFDRLMLPIKNVTGSIAAFAGRSLDGSEPKYLNSAESELFHKRYTLFNIDKAKDAMKKSGKCLVVEGYFDVMRLYKSGYQNTVAPMGTALTIEQINLIKRYASEVILVFDGDAAGEKAANKSLSSFVQVDMFPKVVFLGNNEDPDTFILQHGVKRFSELVNKSEDLFINISRRLANSARGDFNKKLEKYQPIKRMLSSVKDVHLKEHYSEKVAEIFGLSKQNVLDELSTATKQSTFVNQKKQQSVINADYACELDFIACLRKLPVDTIDSLMHDMSDEMFKNDNIREVFKKILDISKTATYIDNFVHELGEDFIEISMRDLPEDVYKFALTNKHRIVNNYLDKRHAELIKMQETATTIEDKIKYIEQIDQLAKQRVALNNL